MRVPGETITSQITVLGGTHFKNVITNQHYKINTFFQREINNLKRCTLFRSHYYEQLLTVKNLSANLKINILTNGKILYLFFENVIRIEADVFRGFRMKLKQKKYSIIIVFFYFRKTLKYHDSLSSAFTHCPHVFYYHSKFFTHNTFFFVIFTIISYTCDI